MVARLGKHKMNRDEVLAKIFADQDSDVSDFSDNEFELGVSEESEESEEEDKEHEDESSEEELNRNEPENIRGGCGREGGRTNHARKGKCQGHREEQERLLEAKWTSVDQDPQIPQMTATPGI